MAALSANITQIRATSYISRFIGICNLCRARWQNNIYFYMSMYAFMKCFNQLPGTAYACCLLGTYMAVDAAQPPSVQPVVSLLCTYNSQLLQLHVLRLVRVTCTKTYVHNTTYCLTRELHLVESVNSCISFLPGSCSFY